jgi:hypothetical protein
MITSKPSRSTLFVAALCLSIAGTIAASARPADDPKDSKRPSLSVKASPPIGFSPARILLVAELKGGPNDYEEFYCAGTEWDWGDGTRSEATADCEPYQAGKSEIRRRFSTEHVFDLPGRYNIRFKLKRKDKVLTAAGATVQVQPGIRGPGY